MVILDVRDVRKRIDETHRAVEVFELELAPDRMRVRGELPLRRQRSAAQRHPRRVCSFCR
jgi:hypothetical protein